ncbi:MAG: NAD(P)/FAD-dependent oxidoreductase, partial [Candidatus Halalkalibacterium sp. M3_1C_030]
HKVKFKEGTIETPNIIWAAGVAASPLLSSLETEQDKTGRVKVKEDLSIPEHPNIFVLGDAAHFMQDGSPLPALAPVAIQQGKYIADLIKGEIKSEGRDSFYYIDKGTMATVGRAKAVADIRGFKFSGFFAWILWCFVHILFLIGFRNRFKVFVEWIWFYFTFKRGVRLITNRFSE